MLLRKYGEPVETYARTVLSEESDVSGTDEVVDVCKILFGAMDVLQVEKQMISEQVPDGLCPVQMIPSHITDFVSNMFVDTSLF